MTNADEVVENILPKKYNDEIKTTGFEDGYNMAIRQSKEALKKAILSGVLVPQIKKSKAEAILQAIRESDVGSEVIICNEDGSVFCILEIKCKEHSEKED